VRLLRAEAAPLCLARVSVATHLLRVLSIGRQLLLALTAVAFVLATVLPVSVIAMPMPNGAMTDGTGKPCGDCPDKMPLKDAGKMGCGALTCTGVVVALPTRHLLFLPAFAGVAYPQDPLLSRPGATPPPDPFPPRPTVLL
jgi:hypothetical protein